jgi:hypothetical protein
LSLGRSAVGALMIAAASEGAGLPGIKEGF